MKAFQGSGPVTKPVVSVPKTVSPSNSAFSRKPSSNFTEANVERERTNSATSNSLDVEAEVASLADSVASSHTSSSTVISASKINSSSSAGGGRASMLATYSWNDESNGEIYNDKPSVIEDNSVMYVVENGKEFPLTPVSKRKSAFLSTENLDASHVLPRDIAKTEPVILSKKQVRNHKNSWLDKFFIELISF